MPFDVVIGAYCPLALPVTITTEPPLAVGHARFGIAYEGPPGCVHGGVIAQVFDIMLSVANQLAGAAGPTAQLTVNYRRPTLLYRDTRIEAHVVKTEGRRTHSVGQVLQDGVVTAEAEGWFSALDRAEVIGLRHRRPST
jgi:acyl-coenzyme A thioesterase PaaI-like protein